MTNPEFSDQPQSRPEERTEDELLRGLCHRFLGHNGAILDDAIQLQALSARDAENRGLKFVDIYTQETAVDTPIEKALAVLMTSNGDWLRPSEIKAHFYIYYPVLEMDADTTGPAGPLPGIINWVEKVTLNGERTMYTLTEDGVQRQVAFDDQLFPQEDDGALDYQEAKELFDEVRSFRLAVAAHIPRSA